MNNSTSITNLPDFSGVNEHEDSDSCSGLSYCVEDDISDTDYDKNHELDAKFYSIEEMINRTRRVFDTPNKETYDKNKCKAKEKK